jgi:hypothetical protein
MCRTLEKNCVDTHLIDTSGSSFRQRKSWFGHDLPVIGMKDKQNIRLIVRDAGDKKST